MRLTRKMMINRILPIILWITGITIIALSLFKDPRIDNSRQNIEISAESLARITVNGDTSRTILIVQDSTSGWIWIAVPGMPFMRK